MSYNYNAVGAKSQISKYLALKKVCGGIPPHISSSRWLPFYRTGKSIKDAMRMSSKGLNHNDGRLLTL